MYMVEISSYARTPVSQKKLKWSRLQGPSINYVLSKSAIFYPLLVVFLLSKIGNFSGRKQTTAEFFKHFNRKLKFQLEICSQKQPAHLFPPIRNKSNILFFHSPASRIFKNEVFTIYMRIYYLILSIKFTGHIYPQVSKYLFMARNFSTLIKVLLKFLAMQRSLKSHVGMYFIPT